MKHNQDTSLDKWISIKEKLPTPMESVLFLTINNTMFVGWLEPEEELIYPARKGEFTEIIGISHWMPLPKPPKNRKKIKTMPEKTFENDKKKNSAYWDEIDHVVDDCIRNVATFSTTQIDIDELDDDGEIELANIIADTRELIISKLKDAGCTFPYVEGNL